MIMKLNYYTRLPEDTVLEAGELIGLRKEWNKIPFVYPDNDAERFDQIYDLVMMMADGEIDENEMKVCNKYAEHLGFDKRIVDELVLSISSNITVGNNPEETKERVKFMLKIDDKDK